MLLGLFADGTLEMNNEIASILAFTIFALVVFAAKVGKPC